MPVSTLTETNIPNYSLQQSSRLGSTMIEVVESNDAYPTRMDNFLTPHRKDYYMVVFVRQGNSRHWIDLVPYTLKPNTMYFTVPNQVHLKEESHPLDGMMVCFTNEFLQLEENRSLNKLPVIQNPDNGHELTLTPNDIAFIEDTMRKMVTEFNTKQDWRNQMLQAHLRVLLIYLSRLYTEQVSAQALIPDRALLKRYQCLIEDHFREKHDVAAYADMLNITPGYLNDVVKQQGGKTAITHIHERLVVEAKRMLMHTEASVKEIAYELGFEDAAYFNRFFKRLSNATPVTYRHTIREMYH